VETVGYAALQVIPTTVGFGTALSGQLAPGMTSAGALGSKKFGAGMLAGVAKFAAPLGIALGGAAAFGLVKGAVSQASDLNESVNAVNVTFGKSAAAIKRLGEGAAQSLGLSTNEFNGLAVQFAGFAKTITPKGGNQATFIDDLTQRASDFASVMNLDVNEAARLFQSGLAGETEPLRRYGIDLSAAAVTQNAYKTGLAETGDELTEQQKVQSRYSLLMKSTAKTEGDFQNTKDGLANAQRRLSSEWKNAQAALGSFLLPVIAKVVSFFADNLAPATEWVINAFKGLGPQVATTGGFFDRLRGAIEPIVVTVVTLAKEIYAALLPVMKQLWASFVKDILPALQDAWVAIYKLLGPVVKIIAMWVKWGVTILKVVLPPLIRFIGPVLGFLIKVLAKVVGWIGTVVGWIGKFAAAFPGAIAAVARFVVSVGVGVLKVVNWFIRLPGKILGAIGGLGKMLWQKGVDMIQGLIDGAQSILSRIGEFFLDVLPGWIVGPFKRALGIGSPSKVFFGFGRDITEGLALGIADGAKEVATATKDLTQSFVDSAQTALDKVKTLGQTALDFSKNIASGIREFGSVTALDVGDDGILGGAVSGDMAARLAVAQKFGRQLIGLKRLGLNNASLQQILAAGPTDGSAIAAALLTDGKAAIGQVNSLERQFGAVGRRIGDTGVRSEFGLSTAQARARAGATLNVDKGAITINFDGDPGPGVKRQVRNAIDEAIDRTLAKLEARDRRTADHVTNGRVR